MNLHMKVKLYQRNGMSLVDAQALVLEEAARCIKSQDELLTQCIDRLTVDEVCEIFGNHPETLDT